MDIMDIRCILQTDNEKILETLSTLFFAYVTILKIEF